VQAYRDPDRLRAAIPHGERLKQLPLAPFIGELSYENVTEILQIQRRWFTRPEQKLIDGLNDYIGFKLTQLREVNGGGR